MAKKTKNYEIWAVFEDMTQGKIAEIAGDPLNPGAVDSDSAMLFAATKMYDTQSLVNSNLKFVYAREKSASLRVGISKLYEPKEFLDAR